MNTELIDQIIDSIDTEERAGFDMRDVIRSRPCGTVACIFGHYLMVKYDVKDEGDWLGVNDTRYIPDSTDTIVHEDFGLTQKGINELFFAHDSVNLPLGQITQDNAIEALQDVKEGKFKTWRDYA